MRALLFLLAGCNQFWNLESTEVAVDATLADEDNDTHADVFDNCPKHANRDQNDEDEDGLGDLCDNCPLVANPLQESARDSDMVGDACDESPNLNRDCLILLDAFGRGELAPHWRVEKSGAADPVITYGKGFVQLAPQGAAASILSNDQTGIFDVHVIGRTTNANGTVYAKSNADTLPTNAYWCGVGAIQATNGIGGVAGTGGPTMMYSETPFSLSAEPLGGRALARLSVRFNASVLVVRCQVDYGLAIGFDTHVNTIVDHNPTGMNPGVGIENAPVEVSAIALYQVRSTCPDPIYR